MILSILICSLKDRKENLENLKTELIEQIGSLPVQVISEVDGGEIPVGEKRNILLKKAEGEYISFVDDDDQVSADYISRIHNAVESKPDVVGIEGRVAFNGGVFTFKHSIEYCGWYTSHVEQCFYRTPNHLNPVRRELALSAGFPPEKRFGEDQIYSQRLRPMLKTEEYITDPIYFYGCERTR